MALFAGSQRVTKLEPVAQAFNHAGLPLELALVAGGDEALRQRWADVEWHLPAHVYGYVNNMPSLMMAADFIVCKAGGLIVSEALAAGLPALVGGGHSGSGDRQRRICGARAARGFWWTTRWTLSPWRFTGWMGTGRTWPGGGRKPDGWAIPRRPSWWPNSLGKRRSEGRCAANIVWSHIRRCFAICGAALVWVSTAGSSHAALPALGVSQRLTRAAILPPAPAHRAPRVGRRSACWALRRGR